MVLLGLGTTWGCTRWLHREDFVFELNNKKAGDKSMLKSVLAAEPSQYWLLGFKDRALEREYLEDVIDFSKYRLSVGTFFTLLLFCVFFFQLYVREMLFRVQLMDQYSSAYARDLSNDNMDQSSSDFANSLTKKVNIMGDSIACVIPTIGFLAMFVVTTSYSIGWLKKRKGIVFNLIELSYLLYIFGAIWPYVNGFDRDHWKSHAYIIRVGTW